ncbi:MAG TPA: hypothetical protein VI457_03275 [Methylococcaceae bacterium]|nr:hypothetical protein [Methylococcaceae bacterium]
MKQEKNAPPPLKGWRKLLEFLIGLAILEGVSVLVRLAAGGFPPSPT